MKDLTHYSEVLVELLSIKNYQDLMVRVMCDKIHVGMMIRQGDITSNYENIRLTQEQLDWLIYELNPANQTNLCTRE